MLNLQVGAALILALAFSKSNYRGKVTAKRPTDKKVHRGKWTFYRLKARRHLTTEVDSELMRGSDRSEFIEFFLHRVRKMSFAKIGID